MSTILAIDPGCEESAYSVIDEDGRQPLEQGKISNHELRQVIGGFGSRRVAIEMIASYGMPVGAEVFFTCVWIGRFVEALHRECVYADLVTRQLVKLHHCHSNKAGDSNVRQALVDRFALGQPNHGKGTKAAPGWFYGFHSDLWQAYALAVYIADQGRVIAA